VCAAQTTRVRPEKRYFGSIDESILTPPELAALTGVERFSFGETTVLDFWRWALGDLRMNNARGYLAEFLVATAVKSKAPKRVEWGAQDVVAADGTRIEVKTSAYLQSWAQRAPSTPRFSFSGPAETWNEILGAYERNPAGRVDVWVFCLQTCQDHAAYDPLSVEQWLFWAAPSLAVDRLNQKTGGLAAVNRVASNPVAWIELGSEVVRAAEAQKELQRGS
jgi:hypothetical protein